MTFLLSAIPHSQAEPNSDGENQSVGETQEPLDTIQTTSDDIANTEIQKKNLPTENENLLQENGEQEDPQQEETEQEETEQDVDNTTSDKNAEEPPKKDSLDKGNTDNQNRTNEKPNKIESTKIQEQKEIDNIPQTVQKTEKVSPQSEEISIFSSSLFIGVVVGFVIGWYVRGLGRKESESSKKERDNVINQKEYQSQDVPITNATSIPMETPMSKKEMPSKSKESKELENTSSFTRNLQRIEEIPVLPNKESEQPEIQKRSNQIEERSIPLPSEKESAKESLEEEHSIGFTKNIAFEKENQKKDDGSTSRISSFKKDISHESKMKEEPRLEKEVSKPKKKDDTKQFSNLRYGKLLFQLKEFRKLLLYLSNVNDGVFLSHSEFSMAMQNFIEYSQQLQRILGVSREFRSEELQAIKSETLFPLLDCLGEILSSVNKFAFENKEKNNTKQIVLLVQKAIFEDINTSLQSYKWCQLIEIIPYQTDFDARYHRVRYAKKTQQEHLKNKILVLHQMGIASYNGLHTLQQANVTIAR